MDLNGKNGECVTLADSHQTKFSWTDNQYQPRTQNTLGSVGLELGGHIIIIIIVDGRLWSDKPSVVPSTYF